MTFELVGILDLKLIASIQKEAASQNSIPQIGQSFITASTQI